MVATIDGESVPESDDVAVNVKLSDCVELAVKLRDRESVAERLADDEGEMDRLWDPLADIDGDPLSLLVFVEDKVSDATAVSDGETLPVGVRVSESVKLADSVGPTLEETEFESVELRLDEDEGETLRLDDALAVKDVDKLTLELKLMEPCSREGRFRSGEARREERGCHKERGGNEEQKSKRAE